jgi:membrane protease subunit HflK
LDNAVKNDGGGGPWGGRDEDSSGSPSGGDGQRQPWGQPRRRRPDRPPVGPPAIEALLRKGRERFGGRLPEPAGRPLWVWGSAIFVVLWLLLTCVHRIEPQQRGVLSRLGRYAGTLEPGLSLSFPAPIDSVRKLAVEEPHTVEMGMTSDRADNPMLTADHNVVNLAYAVRWKIRDPELYAYGSDDLDGLIGKVGESVMRGEIANAPLDRVLGPEKPEIAEDARARMQELLDSYQAGIAVIEVTIRRADPPKEVAEAFKQVAAARQERQQRINGARIAAQASVDVAEGDAAQFNAAYVQYRLAPQVTRDRLYYNMMDDVLANSTKIVTGVPGITLPLSDLKRRPAPQGQELPPIDVEAKR